MAYPTPHWNDGDLLQLVDKSVGTSEGRMMDSSLMGCAFVSLCGSFAAAS